jgi:hypothetical protein
VSNDIKRRINAQEQASRKVLAAIMPEALRELLIATTDAYHQALRDMIDGGEKRADPESPLGPAVGV